ncbi:hypothetical protein RD792_006208 [Penstemon davidsonii]|uniref:Uncharacterized protein n=1 Tax=Penstemon davidsonii TaxID=160366 RepID=A0ABR0DCY2_9LAMI|nr:hypothetical protein RD792_006208 [Penstemon davidsonii]
MIFEKDVKDLYVTISPMWKNSIVKTLGVGDIEFVPCSSVVYQAMVRDFMKNFTTGIPSLLDHGVKLLVYAGEYDLICNWLGNWRWVSAMKWYGQKKYELAPSVPFVVDGVKKGLIKRHGPLTFIKVHNAGHMVPMDQPKASLEMLRSRSEISRFKCVCGVLNRRGATRGALSKSLGLKVKIERGRVRVSGDFPQSRVWLGSARKQV